MRLDDQLKREAGMLFEGENLKPVPEGDRQYQLLGRPQIPISQLAWQVLENERIRQERKCTSRSFKSSRTRKQQASR